MSHEILELDNMLSNSNVTPWHKKGIIIDDKNISANDAFIMAGLTENVYLEDLTTMSGLNAKHKGIVRKGICHGVVKGTRYQCLSDKDVAIEAQYYIDNGFSIETCGSLRNGRDIFCALNPNLEANISADDKVKGYFNLLNTNDGKTSFRAGLSITRVVCANTMTASLNEGSMLCLGHTKETKQRIEAFRHIAIQIRNDFDGTVLKLKEIKNKKANVREVLRYFKAVFDVKALDNKDMTMQQIAREEMLMNLFKCGKGNEGATWSDALNAVTEYTTHIKGKDIDNRIFNSIAGSSALINKKALMFALAA